MDRLAGDGAGGGRPTAGEATVVDELVVGELLLLTVAVDVEVVGAVEAEEEDGLLLFRWLALALAAAAALLLASADVSPDPPLLVPLTGSCCDGGGYISKKNKEIVFSSSFLDMPRAIARKWKENVRQVREPKHHGDR